MYYASFFPAAVRPFDGRGPLDGVAAALGVGRGGERGEIPLDLSLKHVRPDGSDATEELLLLEHRKLAAAYGRHLLDPAAFLRLQHYQQRVAADAFLQQAFGSAASVAQHHALAAARMGCLDQQVAFHSAASARAPTAFLEPAAALALSMRGAGAPALAPGDLARSLYPPTAATALPAGYSSMFADLLPKPDPCRLAEETKTPSYSRPSTNGAPEKTPSYITDPVRFAAEHLQRLQDGQQSKYGAVTTSSSGSSSTSSREHKKSSSSSRHSDSSSRHGDVSSRHTDVSSRHADPSNRHVETTNTSALNLLGPRPSLGGGISSAFGETVKREDYLTPSHLPFYPPWGLPPMIPPVTTAPPTPLLTPGPQKKKEPRSEGSSRSKSHHSGGSSSRSSSNKRPLEHDEHGEIIVIDEEQQARMASSLRTSTAAAAAGGRPPPPPEPQRAKMPRLEAMQPPDEAKTSHGESKRPAKSPLSPPPLIAAVPPATSPKTGEAAAIAAILKQSPPPKTKVTTPHDEKPTLNFYFRDHKQQQQQQQQQQQAVTTTAPSTLPPKTTTTESSHLHQHLQYLQQQQHLLHHHLPLLPTPLPAVVGSGLLASPPRDVAEKASSIECSSMNATTSLHRSRPPCKDVAAPAKSSLLERVKEERTVEATTVRIQKENGGVRYSIHPKKRRLDADGRSETCSETDARSRSQSPERADQRRRSRPLSRSADSAAFASLRPELRQKRMQYHAVRRRKLRSGLDMIRRRKRTPSAKSSKPAVADRTDSKPFGELKYDAPPDLTKIPVNKATGETVLHRAARLGHVDLAWCCLESSEGGSVESRDKNGVTPLHEAASRGRLRVARALLQCGADPDSAAINGRRPLHDAVENGHVEVVRLLLSYGADASLPTSTGLTPLELARSPVMVELLRGFLSDMAGESIDGSPVLPWHFGGTASFMDADDSGFDVLADAPSEDSMDDSLFKLSRPTPLPAFRLAEPPTAFPALFETTGSDFIRFEEVLYRTHLTADEFRQRFPGVEVFVSPSHDVDSKPLAADPWLNNQGSVVPPMAEVSHLLSPAIPTPVQVVRLDATLRSILGLHSASLR
ncbi:unnamed protein product [Ixodes hexagonus]